MTELMDDDYCTKDLKLQFQYLFSSTSYIEDIYILRVYVTVPLA